VFELAPMPRFRLYTRGSDYVHLFRDLLLGRATRGDDAARLERDICQRFDVPYAVCLPQGRVGVYLAVKHSITPGQKVILSPYTIADVINMVICAGGRPVFADIDRPSTNIQAGEVERLIDDDTGAVMVTHLHGLSCDIERIAEICRGRQVPLIEDAAQAFGARVHGRAVGTFGGAGVFSFGMYKNVTAFYGGMIVTPDERLYRAVRAELDAAPYMSRRVVAAKALKALVTDVVTSPLLFNSCVYWLFRFGYLHDISAINKHVMVELDTARKQAMPADYLRRFLPVQARMVLRQLPRVDADAAVRIAYARLYHQALSSAPDVIVPAFRDDGSYVYNYFPLQYHPRTALVRSAMQQRRDLAVQHLKNCAGLPSFAPEHRDCPNAEATAAQVVLLPNYPRYGERSVLRTIAAIGRFLAGRGERFSDGDVQRLAELHRTSLPDSNVSVLGAEYARAFYRYVTTSARELTIVDRDAAGHIAAAAVISLDPATLPRRLVFGTPLLRHMLRHGRGLFARAVAPGTPEGGRSNLPELILIYTSPEERGRGRATSLIRRAESHLRGLGIDAYEVKTVADPSNPTLAFYRNRGFTPRGTASSLSRSFQVFERQLHEG